jgi:hypothetical protein
MSRGMRTLRTLLIVTIVAAGTGVLADTTRVLWRDPGLIQDRDLFWGVGSAERAPKSPFTFVGEDLSGTKPKVDVTDAAGVAWSVKFPEPTAAQNEVHAEIAATRLASALGYFVDENYFVAEGRMDGVKNLKRAATIIGSDGTFRTARFERRDPAVKSIAEWHIEKNPFVKTKELSGLLMLSMLLGNWDIPPHNAAVRRVTGPDGEAEDRYLVSDWGSAFGRMRGGVGEVPSRWNIDQYAAQKLVSGVSQGQLRFRFPLTGNTPLAIPVEHAKWFMAMVSQLTDAQIRRAFEASGASPAELDAFSKALSRRISEINAALAGGS